MKILVLHQFFRTPGEGGAINSYMRCKALVDHGHRVVVITTSNEKKRHTTTIDGIEVHYLPVTYDNRFGYYSRGWAFLKYVLSSARAARKFADFDRCYAISAPLTVGIIALWISMRYRIPFYFEVGDLWPDAPVQLGYIRNYFSRKFFSLLERRVYRRADAVVALSPPIREAILQSAPGKPVFMIPNMADCEFFQPEPKQAALEDRFNVKGKFVISYLGAMGAANGLEFLLRCADAANARALPVQFILCGDGAKLESLRQSAHFLNLQNVTFIRFANRMEVRDIMNVTDAVFVSYAKFPILETGSPNKFFDGLAAGKLILVNFGGWIREEIEKQNCGAYIDYPDDLPDVIERFMNDKTRLQEFQAAARKLGEMKYSRKKLCEEFVSLFA